MLGAATIGALLFKPITSHHNEALTLHVSLRMEQLALLIFVVLLLGLPWLAHNFANHTAVLVDTFFRAGSLVFGGGHVVLPKWYLVLCISLRLFLGAAMSTAPNGWLEGMVAAVIAIFYLLFF